MDTIDTKKHDHLIELGYTFEVNWKGYRVEYNGKYVGGGEIVTSGYAYKDHTGKQRNSIEKIIG